MAINLQSLVEQGMSVKIEVTAADLKMFGEGIAEQAISTPSMGVRYRV